MMPGVLEDLDMLTLGLASAVFILGEQMERETPRRPIKPPRRLPLTLYPK